MQETIVRLARGDTAPEFSLQATDGARYTLDSFAGSDSLVVVFLANHCPFVSAWEDRILSVASEFSHRGVAFVGISSNLDTDFPTDSFDEMRRRAEEKEYSFPYLHDSDQIVARLYGATRTPEVFVFDKERRLQYHGAVDSDFEEGSGTEFYLRDALNRLVTGQSVTLPETPVVGCRIKFH